MDHEHNGHHEGMDHSKPMCSMNMLFTWSYENLCIVFPQWHISGTPNFILSLFAIVMICVFYEGLRYYSRKFELKTYRMKANRRSSNNSSDADDEGRVLMDPEISGDSRRRRKVIKAIFYGIQILLSFSIMLIFMTYNGFVMLAVMTGATLGYYIFMPSTDSKGMACH
ncbi:Copper transport protein CTR2 [Neolecta irregularis DAH-3]|uniref:Copper transport protein n=1 Tax=Neolecta irregularis (strain DAH-3) TaxID=1198029 RepID=A0A1U7LNY4_NEOID|nr:Copper transport protein CTR2 [Neolecta irregularis DAH-3]|eukprot:OLL24380.1 Copper transport protein CTR2 [Neolecta irregularis DAH-3]